ncbi:MAG TPA: hypothetical protein VJT31_20955 [Rugosimonospora sp.]|nr:hypothetical protein [Rugosimonospora sp.]
MNEKRVTYYGTGIANERAARRYLHHKFKQAPLEPIQRRPGARFYVSARLSQRTALLYGPYVSHMTALANVPAARRRLAHTAFVAVGTCSAPVTLPTRYGR